MQTFIHYATPPGWQPRPTLPTLRRAHVPTAPQVGRGSASRPQPAARVGWRPERPDPSDRDEQYAAFGLPWQTYLVAAVCGVALLVLAAVRLADGVPAEAPAIGAVVTVGVSLWGLADYARAGAAAHRTRR